MFCTCGSVGLGTVWLRYQISATANRVRASEQKIAEVERRIAEAVTEIEAEQSPDVLRRRNQELSLGLADARETMVVRDRRDEACSRLAAKRNREIFNDGPVFVSFNLGEGAQQ